MTFRLKVLAVLIWIVVFFVFLDLNIASWLLGRPSVNASIDWESLAKRRR